MIDRNQELAEKYLNTGLENSKKGKVDLAIEDYTKAIELKPDYADAYYYRSKAWLHFGKVERAKSDMVKASEIGINSKTALDDLMQQYGRAWKILGNVQ